jgi:translation elongation factor EF-G
MGSAFKYKGLQLLLDGVLNYFPSPNVASNYALDQSKNGKKVRDSKKLNLEYLDSLLRW